MKLFSRAGLWSWRRYESVWRISNGQRREFLEDILNFYYPGTNLASLGIKAPQDPDYVPSEPSQPDPPKPDPTTPPTDPALPPDQKRQALLLRLN